MRRRVLYTLKHRPMSLQRSRDTIDYLRSLLSRRGADDRYLAGELNNAFWWLNTPQDVRAWDSIHSRLAKSGWKHDNAALRLELAIMLQELEDWLDASA